ncbi:MAG TPA: conjugative transfer signal peptidase TraF [Thermoanaerobaculia bacterium]|nr:conjugative transfer signal peptidase TraF [Thermoanaerobaculia bacterium]
MSPLRRFAAGDVRGAAFALAPGHPPASHARRAQRRGIPSRGKARMTLALSLATAAGLCLAALGAPGLRLELSASLRRGLYRLDPLAGTALVPGKLVAACPPPSLAALARARGYLRAGLCPGGVKPLGKLVLAAAGDLVELAPAGLRLNGQALPATAQLTSDSRGRPLPHYPAGCYRVLPGEVWLISPHPRSLDSRTFGPLPASQVLGVLTPLLTATGADPRPLAALLRRASSCRPGAPAPASPCPASPAPAPPPSPHRPRPPCRLSP